MRAVKVRGTQSQFSAELCFPGDKSLSHRAIISGSLAEGVSSFTNVLWGGDCVCTRRAFESLGVEIQSKSLTELSISGRGLRSLKAPREDIYLGNSGTSMRLLLGILAGNKFEATVTGDPSLSSRPMRRVTDYLRQMGASFEGKDNANFAPIRVRGGDLHGIDARLSVPSAQVKSALLLAGLYAKGVTRVTEPVKSRDHTERFLKFFGADLKEEGLSVSIAGGQALKARSLAIPGDISSAAFFMALPLLVSGAVLRYRSVLWNPTRTGIVDVMKKMGAEVLMEKLNEEGPEPSADFSVRGAGLHAFEVKREELPPLIDEIPILMVLATQARGTTVIREASELRVKESDRIHSMTAGLLKMGAKVRVEDDTLFIEGPTPLKGAVIDSFKDHRTAMAFIMAGMAARGETVVKDVDCIDTSFPNFFELLGSLGAAYQMVDTLSH